MLGAIHAVRSLARRHLVFLVLAVALVGAGQLLVRVNSAASLQDAELRTLCSELQVQVSRLSELAALAELAETDDERRDKEKSFRQLVSRIRTNHDRLFSSLQASHLSALTDARRFETNHDLVVYNLEKLTRFRVEPTWRRQVSAETAQRYRASLSNLQVLLTRSAESHAQEGQLVGLVVLALLILAAMVQILAVSRPVVRRALNILRTLEARTKNPEPSLQPAGSQLGRGLSSPVSPRGPPSEAKTQIWVRDGTAR